MDIKIDTNLAGLGALLAEVMPAGATPTALRLASTSLRLDAHAPLVGAIALTASVESATGRMRFFDFDIEGAPLLRPIILHKLRAKAADLDVTQWKFHATGQDEGASILLTWQ